MQNASLVPDNHLILACIDGSIVTQSVCDYAAWYANEVSLPVMLLHAISIPKSHRHDLSGAIGMDSRKHLMSELASLDQQKARIANQHGEALVKDAKSHILSNNTNIQVSTHLRHGKLLPAISHFGTKSRMVIIGRRGTDHQNNQMTIGSHIESVVRSIHRPILVCSEHFSIPTSFMLAFDGSTTAKKAVQSICESDLPKNMVGHIVMVGYKDTQQENALYHALKQMQVAGLNMSAHIIDAKGDNSDVVEALTAFRRDNDISMTVMGAYGHSKLRRLFVGSTTTKLLTKTTAPVLLLH